MSSTLSSVLQPAAEVPDRYLLSPRAAGGILTRAHRRNRVLPEPLRSALEQVAGEYRPDPTAETLETGSETGPVEQVEDTLFQ